ncbi:MAG TPA: DUF6585 family protein [bacterium]|nr:DUF6585 family protein [bacterium]
MEDPRFGLPTGVHRIPEEFGDKKLKGIVMFSLFLGVTALILTVMSVAGIHDLVVGAGVKTSSVVLAIIFALVSWGLLALVLVGGLSSRKAGKRSEIRVYQNGFVLIQGKRFGGEIKDACLWDEIESVSAKRMGNIFLGFSVAKKDGSKIFLTAYFEGVESLKPLADRAAS